MASVTAKYRFTCPHCDKVVRTNTQPVRGKSIRCPGCDERFVPDSDDDDEANRIQTKPSVKAKTKSLAKIAGADTSRNKKSRDRDEDDEAPAKKRSRQEDDDEDEDEDSSSRSKKKGKKKAGVNMMLVGLLVLGGGGFVLALGAVVLTAFVWPGFMLSKPADKNVAADKAKDTDKDGANKPGPIVGGGPAPLPVGPVGAGFQSYVLANASSLGGLNVKGLRDSNHLEALLNKLDSIIPPNSGIPNSWKDIVRSCEKVLLSASAGQQGGAFGGPPAGVGQPFGGPPPKLAIAFHMSNAEAVAKVKAFPGFGFEEKLAGKYPVRRLVNNDGGESLVMAFPSDRVILIAMLTDKEMTALLDNGAKNEPIAPQLSKMIKMVDQSHVWLAGVPEPGWREQMQNLDLMVRGQANVPPLAVAALQAVQTIRGSGVTMDIVGAGNLKFQFIVDCDDAQSARTLKEGGDFLKVMAFQELRKPQLGGNPLPSLEADLGTMAFVNQGTVTSASMTISNQTLADAGKLMPGVGGGQKEFPPIKNPPKVGPAQSYNVFNMQNQGVDDHLIRLQQGQQVTITAQYNATTPNTYVDLYIFRGPTTNNQLVKWDENKQRPTRVCNATFVVPATGDYYVRVINRGPGVTQTCVVTVREQ